MSAGPSGAYRGQRLSLLTQHGKERVMSALISDALGASVELATGFDTDTLGTFTRDIARQGDQLEAARAKAEKGKGLLGLDVGIASEGSFGPDPWGFLTRNLEIVILVDRIRGIEIIGQARGYAHHVHQHVSTLEGLEALANRALFPQHGLVLRPDSENDPRVRKGFADWQSLRVAFDETLAQSRSSKVFAESDFRAHMNPTRMNMIRLATANLVERIQSECPRCGMPGFWRTELIGGLPCRVCASPTDEPRAERWACVAADHSEIRDVSLGRSADPARCGICNP